MEQPHPRLAPSSFYSALVMAGISSLLGCATVAKQVGVSAAVGTVYLSKERARIYVTEDAKDIKGCEFIKRVQAGTFWGGFLLQESALEKTISDLTHDSVAAGANVLLVRSKSQAFFGSSSEGDAYRCGSGFHPEVKAIRDLPAEGASPR